MPESLPPQDSNSPLPPPTGQKAIAGGLWLLKLAIVLVAAAVSLAILRPAINVPRERSPYIKCASMLRQIGQALSLYANDYKCYPRTYYDPSVASSFKPDFTGGALISPSSNPFLPHPAGSVGVNNTLAAMFLLVRTTEIGVDTFICPASNQQKDTFSTGTTTLTGNDVSNFSSADNISYSFANPYPTTEAAALGYKWSPNMPADFVIAADRNDGFTTPADAAKVAGVNIAHAQAQQQLANSRNHDRDGQNVLYNDGHVDWVQTMWVGANKDGIYTAAKTPPDSTGKLGQFNPPASKDTTTTDPQLDLDTIMIPKF